MTETDTGSQAEVEELARSFDIWDPSLNDDPYPALQALRQQCPVARSEKLGGYWMVTSYEGVRQVFTNPATFSSRILQVPVPDEPPVLIPETLDPPTHTVYRHVMAPLFSPPAIATLEPATRELARSLVSDFAAKGGGDFVEAVALPLPATMFLNLLGLPVEDLPRLLTYRDALMRDSVSSDPEVATHANEVVMPAAAQYFGEAIAARRAMSERPDDLLAALVERELDIDGGRTMTDEEIVNTLFLLIAAGLDTVTALLSKAVGTLAERPDLRQQLLDDPAVTRDATEEFLRYWSLVSTCREARSDVELQGAHIRAGEVVTVSTPAAGRDPQEFENPDQLDFRRSPNRHLAFGAGPHRCIGSHLARMEITVTLEEVMKAMPDFSPDPTEPPVHRFGQVMGVEKLPLVVGS